MSEYPQRDALFVLLDGVRGPDIDATFVSEALYTLEETGYIDFRIDTELAFVIWKIVQASYDTYSDEYIKEVTKNIRM